MQDDQLALTAILNDLNDDTSRDASLTRLLPDVYQELRGLAEAYLRSERADHTLQATGLVHEAYVRLADGGAIEINDRTHFFRLASVTMRRILVDYARSRAADKRGGGVTAARLTDTALLFDDRHVQILEIDDALTRLSSLHPGKARVVELRYYGGCTIDETARALDMSTATVERHWRFARAWLRDQLIHDE